MYISMFNSTYTYIMQKTYSRIEVEMKKKKQEEKRAAMKETKKRQARDAKDAKDAKNTKNVSASSSRPSQNNAAQQPSGEAWTPPTPEPHSIGVPISSTPPVIPTHSAGTAHWTRFLSACCSPAQNAEGDH
jgi:hypothetical protein